MNYKIKLLIIAILFIPINSLQAKTNEEKKLINFRKTIISKIRNITGRQIILGIAAIASAKYMYDNSIPKRSMNAILNIIEKNPGSCLFVSGLALQVYLTSKSYASTQLPAQNLKKLNQYAPGEIKTKFSDVAGAAEAKEDLQEIIEFLKNPAKFEKLGAKIPKGVLLTGEPGNGKTLLAKAVAGEANCSFFNVSGSEFIELFIGSGAAKIRNLFEEARKNSPSIIFIDEIDSIGQKRTGNSDLSGMEPERTLNQLLTELDGFASSSVIVIGATNRAEVLDPALVRPGRFDRKVYVPYPDIKSRVAILKVHSKNVPLNNKVDLNQIAKETPGFSGADLASLINEAAIIAAQKGRNSVDIDDISEARDKITIGKPRKDIQQSKSDLEVTAYHEAGHALIRLLSPDSINSLYKVTILPQGHSLGSTHSLPENEKYSYTKEELESEILTALGGRAAEELIFNKITTGASDDFKKATNIAYQMVTHYGMSKKLGPIYCNYKTSEATANLIDEEIRDLIADYYNQTTEILKNNESKLELLAKTLLEKETLYLEEIKALLSIK